MLLWNKMGRKMVQVISFKLHREGAHFLERRRHFSSSSFRYESQSLLCTSAGRINRCWLPPLNNCLWTLGIKKEDEIVKQEFLFSESLNTARRGNHVSRTVQNFFVDKGLQWTSLVGMCTDGTTSIMGNSFWFKGHIKQVAPHATQSLCVS